MVLDDSEGLAVYDKERLRGSALKLLLEHPSSDDRVIGGVEAAERPAEIFRPFVPGELRPKDQAVAEGFVNETVQHVTAPGDLRVALDVARVLNPDMRSAIVVAGTDAISTPGPPPAVVTDVVGVGVTPGSSQDSMLRGLATTSGGRYRRVGANELQAQVARLDARRRCETRVKVNRRRHRIGNESRPSTVGTVLPPGYEIDATATIDAYRSFADLVVTWTSPDVTVAPYELIVDENQGPHRAEFSHEQVEAAVSGNPVHENGIRLTGGGGATFITLRVGFGAEDSVTARLAGHKKHTIHWGGGSRSSGYAVAARAVRVYLDVFEPEPTP